MTARLDDEKRSVIRGKVLMLFNDISGGDPALADAIIATVSPVVAEWLEEAAERVRERVETETTVERVARHLANHRPPMNDPTYYDDLDERVRIKYRDTARWILAAVLADEAQP